MGDERFGGGCGLELGYTIIIDANHLDYVRGLVG